MSEVTPDSLLIVGGVRGRPPRAGVRADHRVQFRMTPQECEALKQVATELGQPVADIMRDAVNEFVADFSERRVFRSKAIQFE